jgi:hypothetical protein
MVEKFEKKFLGTWWVNELILNGNYLVCRGCATGSGQDETRESDVGQSLLPSSSSNTEVKFS